MFASKFRLIGSEANDCIACVGASGQGGSLILEDFAILDPLTPVGDSAIAVINNSRSILRRISIDGSAQGVWVASSYACVFEQLYLTNMLGTALAFNSDYSSNNATIRECSFFANSNTDNQAAIAVPNCQGTLVILGNDIEGNYQGMAISDVPKGKINGNWLEENANGNIVTSSCGSYPDFDTTSNYSA